jgi:ATP-binding cassette, subfamily B, multidrug efflux pump
MKTPQSHTAPPRIADLRWFAYYLRRHRFATFMALATGALGGLTDALQPYLVGVIVDHLSQGVNMTQILTDIGLLVAFSFATLVMFFGQRHYSGVVAYVTHYDMRRDIFDNLITLDQSFYNQYATGDLLSRLYSDLQYVWRVLAIGMNRGGSATFGLILTFILLGSVNLPLTAVVFLVLFISTSFQMWAGLAITPLSERVQEQQGVISSLVQDTASGIQTLKSFGREGDASRKFHQENLTFKRKWLFFKRRNEPVGMLPQAISQLAAGVVVVVGGFMTLNGTMTLGNFTQFLLYLTFISRSLLEIGTIYQRFMQTRGALKRVTPLLQETKIADAPHAKALPNALGDIRFENMSYAINGKTLLHDIDLHIPHGTVVALVGHTGCGKTTLVNCLARAIDVSAGAVKIDGIDVRDIRLDDLRQAIAYVPQSTFLFSLPLHENIRMGKPHISDDDLANAVHISRLSNDLPQLPQGLETLVGEKGVMLSGGQKQRVAIARAIVRDPAILVLDDALSSVDTKTSADILGDLRHVLRTRTSIIIAHRIATVKDADLIVVMDEGRIVEQGNHASLIAQNGMYARMVERELQDTPLSDTPLPKATLKTEVVTK